MEICSTVVSYMRQRILKEVRTFNELKNDELFSEIAP